MEVEKEMDAAEMEGIIEENSASTTAATPRQYKIELNKQWLMQLEGALQLHFNQTKTKQITFPKFRTIVSKLALDSPLCTKDLKEETSASVSSSSSPSSPIWNLVKEERLWHDLYCIAVPDLYTVNEPFAGDTKTRLTLDLVPFKGNRWKEVRRKLENYKSNEKQLQERSIEALEFLSSLHPNKYPSKKEKNDSRNINETTTSDKDTHRQPKRTKLDPAAASRSTETVSSDAVVKPGMTLEERVRARAQIRGNILAEVEEATKDPKEERLQIADVLFGYARAILRRRRAQGRSSSTSTTTKCVSTFQDILTHLPRDLSQRQIEAILHGIVQMYPGFVTWIDPKNGENGIPITNMATIFIQTGDYKQTRAVLSGKATNKSIKSSTTAGQSSEQARDKYASTIASRAGSRDGNILSRNKRAGDSLAKLPSKSLKSLTTAVARTAKIVQKGTPIVPPAKRRSSSIQTIPTPAVKGQQPPDTYNMPNVSSRKRPAIESKNEKDVYQQQQQQHHHQQNHGRENNDDDNDNDDIHLPSKPKKPRKKKLLRINPNFILCDADYDGGGIIEPSLELPRGLRKLFLKLNAGQRI